MQTIAWNKKLLQLKQGQKQLISTRKQGNKRLDFCNYDYRGRRASMIRKEAQEVDSEGRVKDYSRQEEKRGT